MFELAATLYLIGAIQCFTTILALGRILSVQVSYVKATGLSTVWPIMPAVFIYGLMTK